MYEHRKQPLASKAIFYSRVLKNIIVALFIIAVCLAIGTAGYHYTADMSWLDAFHNASMILSGMGLVDHVESDGGKLFSSFYSLFSGIAFITNIGIILAPALHRIYHRMHIEE
mgnify:CR=1 FL=1